MTHRGGRGEEVGVVTALLQVHHDVQQGHLAETAAVERLKVTRQDVLVVLPADGNKKTYWRHIYETCFVCFFNRECALN